MNKKLLIYLFVIGTFLLSGILRAQVSDYNHPELRWFTFETEHFIFHFHNGTEQSANRFASVAEHVYDTITKLYNYRPQEKMRIIINDYEDYANGGAYFYNNKINLWCPNLDTELRGTHNWFRNVFTHEFTHMIQLNSAKKMSDYVPGVYLQYTGYEREKRKDVLTGFPNILTSYNLPMHVIPGWFAEGVAQNQAYDTLRYDFWDANRDMLFRERLLSGNQFTYEKLEDFGNKSSHEAESVYNTGMAFLDYIFKHYGKDAPDKISREMGKFFTYSFSDAVKEVTGLSVESIYADFIKEKENYYHNILKTINANLVEGKDISDSAYVNSHPVFSPSGRYLAYLSTKENGEATFYRRSLYIKDLVTDSIKLAIPAVSLSSFSWSPDEKYIYFSQVTTHKIYGYKFYDIYRWDIKNEEDKRLTFGLRAANPEISPDGKKISFVRSVDGTQNLWIMDADGKNLKNLTNKTDGTQYYKGKWSKDSKKLLVSYSDKYHGRDIALMDLDGKILYQVETDFDYRDPVFGKDDNEIFYASDQTGIFNIYRKELKEAGKEELITNVRGGAFYPAYQAGKLVYANYKGIKMNLYEIADIKPIALNKAYYKDYLIPETDTIEIVDYAKNKEPYSNDFEHLTILPRLTVDNNSFKPGAYFLVNDYLERMSLFGAFAVNSKLDYDLFLQTEFRIFLPTLYGLGVNVVKHADNNFINEDEIVGYYTDDNGIEQPIFDEYGVEYTYDIKEYNVGLKMPISPIVPEFMKNAFAWYNLDFYFAQMRNKATAKYPEFSLTYVYYKDKVFNFKFDLASPVYGLNGNISPDNGRSLKLKIAKHSANFIKGFELDEDYGRYVEAYNDYNYLQYDLEYRENFSLPLDLSLSTKFKASFLDKDSIASFFDNYIGGLEGLKGYSFYSIGGTRTAQIGATLRFPILKRVDQKLFFFNLKKIYGGVFAEAGTAWNQDEDNSLKFYNSLKKNLGINLRIYGVSFLNMPTAIDYYLAYGFDEFKDGGATYGKEFRSYLTVLFNFLDL